MKPTFQIVMLAVMAAIGVTAGCKNQPPATTASSGRALTIPPATPAITKPPAATTEPAEESSELLARKAESYARQMEELLERQRAAATRSSVTPDAAAPAGTGTPKTTSDTSIPRPAADDVAANHRVSIPPAGGETAANAPSHVVEKSESPSRTRAVGTQVGAADNGTLDDDALAERFLRRIHDYPNEIAPQLDYQLLQFVRGMSVPVMRPMAGMRERDRDLLNALLDALTNFRNAVRADNSLLQSQKIKPFTDLSDRLGSQADLNLPTLLLCRRVDGFGAYEPIEPARFSAGKAHPVIIYCEVASFASVRDDKQMWVTKISEKEVLYTEAGMQVWPANPQPRAITDTCRNRRHDFFIVKLIHLPATLTIGRYLLKVTIVDEQSNRMAEGTIPIDIVAE